MIDTAGIKRKSKVNEDIERYSVIRAIAAIERADVCVLLIDAETGVSEQDKKIAGYAHEAGKGIIIAVNKWDLVDKTTETGMIPSFEIQGKVEPDAVRHVDGTRCLIHAL